jgi:argininosuccinate lyase
VAGTLQVNAARMAEELAGGFSQATDLAEFVVQKCAIDYRTAYVVVGETVRAASRCGLRGVDITGEMLDNAAIEYRGRPLGLAGTDLTAVLDPQQIVLTRTAQGGAAPSAVGAMVESCRATAAELRATAGRRRKAIDAAERSLVTEARDRT